MLLDPGKYVCMDQCFISGLQLYPSVQTRKYFAISCVRGNFSGGLFLFSYPFSQSSRFQISQHSAWEFCNNDFLTILKRVLVSLAFFICVSIK